MVGDEAREREDCTPQPCSNLLLQSSPSTCTAFPFFLGKFGGDRIAMWEMRSSLRYDTVGTSMRGEAQEHG